MRGPLVIALCIACAASQAPVASAPEPRPAPSASASAPTLEPVATPEETCAKMRALADEEAKAEGKSFKLNVEKCLAQLREIQGRDPEAYRCAANVISKVKTLDTAFVSISMCDKNRPKPKAPPDD
jgi:hypothetical protein